MPKLDYTALGFTSEVGSPLNGRHSLEISMAELVWAAITVGRRNWAEVIQHGNESRFEMIYRTAILASNVAPSIQGRLEKTDAYKCLDPSEKSAISYYLGISLAKLAACRLFQIPWLIHLDRIPDCQIKLHGKRRPDLISEDHSGKWGVFEAKGRTSRIDQATIQNAREQTRGLDEIYGNAPSIRVVSISHFFKDELELHLENVGKIDTKVVDVEISGGEDQFLGYYYQPFLSLIENTNERRPEPSAPLPPVERYEYRSVYEVELAEVDLYVGLDSQVYETLTSGAQEAQVLSKDIRLRSGLARQLEEISQLHYENNAEIYSRGAIASFMGPDGILVRLGSSWNVETE